MKKIAVIDLGTNGFRLYIAEVLHKGHFHVIHRESNDLKLASEGIHHIGDAPFQRGMATMRHFLQVLNKYNVHRVEAFGTAALRIADNGQVFMNAVKNETGIDIQLISGEREAELIYKGMKSSIPLSIEPILMVDVGGGSVEFIICNIWGVLWAHSFNIGVAILKQQFQTHDPIEQTEITQIEDFLNTETDSFLNKINELKPLYPVVACGTLDFMVKILRGGYDLTHYLEIPFESYNHFHEKWLQLSEPELTTQPDIPKEKVEMLQVSLVLMNWIIKKLNADKIIASANSMKAGILYEMSF